MRNVYRIRVGLLLGAAIVLAACSPYFPIVDRSPPSSPPYLVAARMLAEDRFELDFSAAVEIAPQDLDLGEGYEIAEGYPKIVSGGSSATVKLEGDLPIQGQAFAVSGSASSPEGNSTWFSLTLFGYNGDPAALVLNEVRIKNSAASPEGIELISLESGNLGGISLIVGMPGGDEQSLRFPALEIAAGEMIVVHFRANSEALQGEHGNYDNPPPGSPVLDGVLNFYLPGGLSDTAELVSLWQTPLADVGMDALFYTDKPNNPDDRYRGFGTKATLELAKFFARSGLWAGAAEDAELVNPEDFASSEGSTVTRTLNRRPGAEAGVPAGRNDWFVGASGTASLGGPNTSEEY